MELFKICDVMSSPVMTIHIEENVSRLAKMLLSNRHSGFPVVKYDRETKADVAYGLVTRYAGCHRNDSVEEVLCAIH